MDCIFIIGGVEVDNGKIIRDYPLKNGKDNTLKQFFERFYIVPKDWILTEEQRKFLDKNSCYISDPVMAEGKDGYIVRRRGKKLNNEQVEKIKNDTGSYRAKAKKYNLSIGTISKIMNDKY